MADSQTHPVDWTKLPLFNHMHLSEYTSLRRRKQAAADPDTTHTSRRSPHVKPSILASGSEDSDKDDEDECDDADSDKRVRIPPLPDMRFEPVFLASIRPYLKTKQHISSTQRDITPEEVLWLTGDVDVNLGGFWWSVFKSQVVMQFLTGVAKALYGLLKLDFLTYLHDTSFSSSTNTKQVAIKWSALTKFFNFGFGGSR